MDKRICVNGHYFNHEKYDICPVCGGEVAEAKEPSNTEAQVNPGPFKPTERLPEKEPPDVVEEAEPGTVSEKKPAEEEEIQEKSQKKKKRFGFYRFEATQKHEEQEGEKQEELSTEPPEKIEGECEEREDKKYDEGIDIKSAGEPETGKNSSSESLSAAIAGTRAGSISALPKTQKYYEYEDHIPPVGWLVCVAGAYTGQVFECQSGKNRIGRNTDYEINLEKEPMVSREVHAILIYEPRQRKFLLQNGTGNGLVYLNENLMLEPKELHAYDHITLEVAEFVFVPLCGEQFTWDDYLAKN